MKNLFALLCLLLPLSGVADEKADAAAAEAESVARGKAAVAKQKAMTPRYRVAATCTFDDEDEGGQGGYIGHWVDSKTHTFETFSKNPQYMYEIELLEWIAGPWFERADIRIDEREKTELQSGRTVNTWHTADGAVYVIDVTATPKIDGSEVFQQKLTLTYDTRTKPVRAYLLRTESFDVESGAGKNERVSVSAQTGNCWTPEE